MSSARSTPLALGEMVSKLLLEKCRRRFEPTQMTGLHEHDRSLNADAGPRDSLQPPALRMRDEKSPGDEPEADAARHKRHLHVDIVDRGGDFEWRAELAQLCLERLTNKAPRRVKHPACIEIAIFGLAAAPWARLRFSRLDQCQTLCRQNAAGQVAGHRVVCREERQRHIELAGPHLLYELLPEIGTQHWLKPGEATR